MLGTLRPLVYLGLNVAWLGNIYSNACALSKVATPRHWENSVALTLASSSRLSQKGRLFSPPCTDNPFIVPET